MDKTSISRKAYSSKNVGDYPEATEILGRKYEKVYDLRYATNPHQTACFYKPIGASSPIGDLHVLKSGKGGLSQTNLEDISYALNICKYFEKPCCACMKHVNPSGVVIASAEDKARDVYFKSRECDPRAAFGCVAGFNCQIDEECAVEIMSTFVECIVAPGYTNGALEVFNDYNRFKRNKFIRILQCGELATLPKFTGDCQNGEGNTIKILADSSLIIAEPLLTSLKGVGNLIPASAESKSLGKIQSKIQTTPAQLEDLIAAWYININVRSNGVVIVKNGESLAVGTGEQDRVGAVEQAVWKYQHKYAGKESIENGVMASDGFFPFYDAVEIAAKAGVTAMIAPGGSVKDAEVIKKANELNVALFFAPERIFSHH